MDFQSKYLLEEYTARNLAEYNDSKKYTADLDKHCPLCQANSFASYFETESNRRWCD